MMTCPSTSSIRSCSKNKTSIRLIEQQTESETISLSLFFSTKKTITAKLHDLPNPITLSIPSIHFNLNIKTQVGC